MVDINLCSKWLIFWRSIKLTWIQFSNRTSIHGFKYSSDRKGNLCTRILWIGIILACFIMANTLVIEFWRRYTSNPTRMNVESNYGVVAKIAYPAITFCSTNYVSIKNTRIFVNSLTLPRNISAMEIVPYFEQTIGFTHRTTYNLSELNLIQEIVDSNRYDTSSVMKKLKISCRDLLFKCRLERKIIDCMELFRTVGTYNGYCCSFNIADFDKENFRSRHPHNFGIGNGLSVVLQPNIDSDSVSKIYSDGVQLLIHESAVYPSDTSVEKILPFQYESLVSIRPSVTSCSKQVQKLPISARDCVFPNEMHLENFKGYKEINCDVDCRIKRTMKKCDCIPFYYPNFSNIPICNFTKITCLLDHYYELHESQNNGSSGISCDCPASCDGVQYEARTDTAPIKISNYTFDKFYEGINKSHMIVHVFMDSQVYKKMRRDLLVNVVGLISNFGGAYSLLLGISVIGFLEIPYYIFIRLFKNYKIEINQEREKLEKMHFDLHSTNSNLSLQSIVSTNSAVSRNSIMPEPEVFSYF